MENLCSPDLRHLLNYFLPTVIYAFSITRACKSVCMAGFMLRYVPAQFSNNREWGLVAFYFLSRVFLMQIHKLYIPHRRFKISGHFIVPGNLFWTAPRNILNWVDSSMYTFKR